MKCRKIRCLFLAIALMVLTASEVNAKIFGHADFAKIIRENSTSVVYVRTFAVNPDFPGDPSALSPFFISASGTGIVYSKTGYIITNVHVIDGAARIEVLLQDKSYLEARVVGMDRANDVALLKVELPFAWKKLKPGRLQKSPLRVGDPVIAVGFPGAIAAINTPSVAHGIISNARAFIDNVSTPYGVTDTPIANGDSGGPLFNAKGEVVGMNSLRSGNSPFGYFVPADIILKTVPKLLHGNARAGWLGIYPLYCENMANVAHDGYLKERMEAYFKFHTISLPEVSEGIAIMLVENAADGETRELHMGDIVTRVNGRKPRDPFEFVQWIVETAPGTYVNLQIIRGGKTLTLQVKVGEHPLFQPAPGNAGQP